MRCKWLIFYDMMEMQNMRQLKAGIYILVMLSLVCIVSFASDTTDEHFNKAREFLNTGKYIEAAEEFKAVVKLAPDSSKVGQNAKYWVGQCYFRMKEFDEALATFEKIIENYPESSIASVARVMMDRVHQEKENEKFKATMNIASDKDVIVDPKTGLKFTRILSNEKLNLLSHNLGLNISPDSRFIFDYLEHWVIPLKEGEDPFNLNTDIIETIYGSWSPDMSKFAFISSQTRDLYVVSISPETGGSISSAKKLIEGTENRQVRGGFRLSWSPDGRRIAFPWMKGENLDIWTISASGGEPTQITDDPRWEHHPNWSPDGKSIIFGRKHDLNQDSPWDMWSVPTEGGTAEKIIEDIGFLYGFSPDGKWFSFYRNGVEGVDILRLSDKRKLNIAPPKDVVGEWSQGPKSSWSPKANKLLFYNSGFEYWATMGLVLVYGGSPVELGKGIRLSAWTQKWSPDGKFIVTLDWETKDLWIIPTDGGTPGRLKVETEPKIWEYPFQPFSPDLKKLAFVTEDMSLWVVPISIEEKRMTGKALKISRKFKKWHVGWSPDSKRIAFSSLKNGNADIWIASIDGKKLTQLTNSPEDETISGWSERSAWSPDGKMMVYRKTEGLWVVPTSGGKPREIVNDALEPVWSPDGKEIAFLKHDDSFIGIVTLDTSEIRQVVNPKESGMVDPEEPASGAWGVTWSPDGKNLSFFTVKRRIDHFWVIPAEGGKPKELASSHLGKWFQFWSPDGKRLSYNSDRDVRVGMGAIWEVDVEEFLSNTK